jgi:L-asparaginase II
MSVAGKAHAPLSRVLRGDAVDSVHYGSVAVVDRDGRLVYAAGDPEFACTTRSALKPLQALPFVADGGVERFGFGDAEIALMCASHSGEPRHVNGVAGILERAGLSGKDLQCGVHVPLYYTALEKPAPSGITFSSLHHNCSGKHAGMLACCRLHSQRTTDYLAPDHPLQQRIRHTVARMAGVDEGNLRMGIDGCSAPNYALPLSRLAYAFARLARPDNDPDFGDTPARLATAMRTHPAMVSGQRRNDLALMTAGGGDWVTKVGAEGIQAVGVTSRGLGIAIKVADGNARGLHPATVAVLDALGLLDGARRKLLEPWASPSIRNYRGTLTGRIEPVVSLVQM